MRMRRLESDVFKLDGGLDLVSIPSMIKPGRLISAINFEPDSNGGYRRIAGIERYDGQPRPSDANYSVVTGTVLGPLLVNDTITGVTSGATAVVVTLVSSTKFVVTKVSGTFVAETYNVSGSPYGTITSVIQDNEENLELHATYKAAAADAYRADILTVPGSGYVRGVVYYQGGLYAFRDNAGGTACVMHKATAAGWSSVSFGQELHFVQPSVVVIISIGAPCLVSWISHGLLTGHAVRFSTTGALPTGLTAGVTYYVISQGLNGFNVAATVGGAAINTSGSQSGVHTCIADGIEIVEGVTVTGATSGATAVVKRALLRTGTWSTAPAGTLVFDSVTGTFQNGELLSVSSNTYAQTSSANTAITLLPGGKFEFAIINLFGTEATERVYCADGINLLGEFDGTRWVPIRTGTTPDTPKFIKEHRKHLVIAIGSSVLTSGTSEPYSWTALTGAAELATGQTITGLSPEVGDATTGALLVLTDDQTYVLYGSDTSNFNLVLHSPKSGGRSYTMQNIGMTHFMGPRGITHLVATQAFGNFNLAVASNDIQPLIDAKLNLETNSAIVRLSNQYRIFFSDGTCLVAKVTQSSNSNAPVLTNFMLLDYGDIVMNTVWSSMDSSGVERLYGAGRNGYVYELDKGTSLDGAVMRFHFMTHFNHKGSLRVRKNYHRTVLQLQATGFAEVKLGYDLEFGKSGIAQTHQQSTSVIGSGSFWDQLTDFVPVWDTPFVQEVDLKTPGNGDSISLILSGSSVKTEPFTVHTAITYFKYNRAER